MVKNGCDQSGHGALKLTVFQNWTDVLNCFFCMLVQIQESWFNHFWMALLKNGSGFLVYETLKSAVL